MTVSAPHCPQHGSLVLDLLRGRLEGEKALGTEELLDRCPACSAWYGEMLSGPEAAAVDRAVSEAFDGLALPPRRRHSGWLRLAAAAVLVLGAGLALRWSTTHPPVDGRAVSRGEIIVSITGDEASQRSLQGSDLGATRSAAEAEGRPLTASASPNGQTIFKAGLEVGELSAWSEPDGFFRGGFEDGGTEVWSNSL